MNTFKIIILATLVIMWARIVVGLPQDLDYFPTQKWRTATPSDHKIDGRKISEFTDQLRQGNLLKPAHSLLIVRNGYLVVEEYFKKADPDKVHSLQSVTKSISSTLIGAAIQQGKIKSLDQKVLEFFPEYAEIENTTTDKRNMTLRHALTMRTGQAWTGESHLGALNRHNGDRMKYVLDYRMEGSPGKKWYYNSGIAVLLGGLLQNAAGIDSREFARQYLFAPLGITQVKWYSYRNIPHTGGGLYLTPRDMAKIGYLYLRDGIWNEQRILPEGWVKDATQARVRRTQTIEGISPGYGYMWWLLPLHKSQKNIDHGVGIFMAYGHWGQFIFIIPEYDMVVVYTNDNTASYREEIKPISLLYEYVLPAVVE